MGTLTEAIVQLGLTKSRSDANRKIKEGAVRVNGVKIEDTSATVRPGDLIRVVSREARVQGAD